MRSCDAESLRFLLGSAPWLRRCPWSVLTHAEPELIRLWRRWAATGVWPYDDPSPRIADAFTVLEAQRDRDRDQVRAHAQR